MATTKATAKTAIDEAVQKMAEQAKSAGSDSQKALHYSQAALNLANARVAVESVT